MLPFMAKKDSVPLTAEQRALRAEVASLRSWAKTRDRSARTAPARAAAMSRFEREVDPDGTMEPAARALAADAARRAHYRSMAFKSARVRAANSLSGRRRPAQG
jgi:hypothetical protein